MSTIDLATPVHRKTALLKDKLTAQNTDIWNEGGTPNYASGTHCELLSGDSLTSIKIFESGVLTFYALAADWTDVIMGFRLADGENEVIYENDDFVSEANNLTPVVSNAVLADGTAYWFKIIWCSQFVSIDVWTLAGVLTATATHRNPTNRAMPLYFTTITADALQIANLSLQEGDDSIFFRNLIPRGIITAWRGAIAEIPAGWWLCDGTMGTLDLRDLFVVGAGNAYAVGATGGSNTHVLTVPEIPSHNHGGLTGFDNIGGLFAYNTSRSVLAGTITVADNDNLAMNHRHTISDEGGDGAHENRPPYYALAWIMKL